MMITTPPASAAGHTSARPVLWNVNVLTGIALLTLAAASTPCQKTAPHHMDRMPYIAERNTSASLSDNRPIIACFGDSLTAGYGVDPESSYPANLQRDLDQAGYRYRVVNLGISGETTKDGLARLDRVLALKPAIVVVEFGGNDGLRGVPISSSRSNLDTMLKTLAHSGTRTVIAGITLPPQYSSPYIKEFNQTYVLLAKQYRLPLLPFVLQNVYGVPGSIQQDGIHPTAQGCVQVARNIMGLIKPLLKKDVA